MFRPDGPLVQSAIKFAKVLYAHVLTLFCCIPVITAGVAFTALEYTLLKISREEDGSIPSDFFHSFKENFKQATILWIVYVVALSVMLFDIYFFMKINAGINDIMFFIMCIITILLLLNMTWGFVLLSRYNNSGMQTFRYALRVSLAYFGYTLAMLALVAIPSYLAIENVELAPYVIVVGVTLSGFVRPKLYGKVFDKIESANQKNTSEETKLEEEHL